MTQMDADEDWESDIDTILAMSDVPPAQASSGSDIDLYCLECGYNLRGLSGDPRRCPECGHLNVVEELTIPAGLIRRQLRRMETAPTVAVGCFVLAVGCLTGLVYFSSVDPDVEIARSTAIASPLLVFCWVLAVLRFRAHCLKRPGWGKALAKYHLVVLSTCAVLISVVISGGVLAGSGYQGSLCWGLPVLAILLIIVGGPWARRYAGREMERLQRDTAVVIAREVLRTERDITSRPPFRAT